MRSVPAVVAGVIIILVEIGVITSIDFSHPKMAGVVIFQFMIFMGLASALISYGSQRKDR